MDIGVGKIRAQIMVRARVMGRDKAGAGLGLEPGLRSGLGLGAWLEWS